MKKPRVSIRWFLVLCLLLGAFVLPRGWRTYQAHLSRKQARKSEIERLERFLAEARLMGKQSRNVDSAAGSAADSPLTVRWKSRIAALEDRLTKLTGNRPAKASK